jgi:ubiquinone/menaquinone biosynthesis C-methylase UbiE
MALIDYEQAAAGYDRARALEFAGLAEWREAITPFVSAAREGPALDAGAGTGQWAEAFASWFGVRVIALEPSQGMRKEMRRRRSSRLVQIVAGTAEHLPLRPASCQVAWLSTVIHHVPDLDRAAREMRRVVRAGGPVLIRSAFPGRTAAITLFRYFPEAAQVVERYPRVDATVEVFARAGFRFELLQSIQQVSAPGLAVFRERAIAGRSSDTTLRSLGDDAFARGLARIDAALAASEHAGPIVDALDLLVLR